jgi:hypothetical protein
MSRRRTTALRVVPVLLALALGMTLAPAQATRGAGHGSAAAPGRPPRPPYVPPIKHVFVINIENKGYDETFGAGTESPYLAGPLRRKGVLLNSYYAVAHNSLPNYIAQISGQAPNAQTQSDCQIYSRFETTGPNQAPGQAVGAGCVLPGGCPTWLASCPATASPGGATCSR